MDDVIRAEVICYACSWRSTRRRTRTRYCFGEMHNSWITWNGLQKWCRPEAHRLSMLSACFPQPGKF